MLPSLGLAICCYLIARLVTLTTAPQSRIAMGIHYVAAAFILLCAFDIFITAAASVR